MTLKLSKFLPFSLLPLTLYAQNIDTTPSFQGFYGAVNTPNAEVIEEGAFGFLYNNQVDDLAPSSSVDFRNDKEQDNYFINIGLLPNLDISLRYGYAKNTLNNKAYLSDRISSFKYQLPFIPNDIIKIALGMQDIRGGAPHLRSTYVVASKELFDIRASLGYAKGENQGSLDGLFGSVEYQPLSWLQVAGEYDTKEWNGVVKASYKTQLGAQDLTLGVMAKTSQKYGETYVGVYSSFPLNNKDSYQEASQKIELPKYDISKLNSLKLANSSYSVQGDTLTIEYENSRYSSNEMDALAMVLGIASSSNVASKIIVNIKKSNIVRYSIETETKAYQQFLKDGLYRDNLLKFTHNTTSQSDTHYSDWLKPTLTLQPDFVIVDGSEYGNMDYTLALQADTSVRLAKGTTFTARYNLPLAISENFDENGIFAYRNRHKTTPSFDQVLLSQYYQPNTNYPWMNLLQVGQFDKDLKGVSFESAISTPNGKHQLMLKVASLKDDIYREMDSYREKNREEKLLSYRYYLDNFNSDIKLTVGEYLYGDKGVNLSFKRYFSDITLELDMSKTSHPIRGDYNVAKLMLSIPLGNKNYQSKYIDIKAGDLRYTRRKTVVAEGEASYAQPHHLKEIENSHTLENYYLDRSRFQPSYINTNHMRLRNVFLNSLEG